MTKLNMTKLLGAAAIWVAAMATPAMAQQAISEPGAYGQSHPYDDGYGYGRSGFEPTDVAAGVVGGAIGTADAIVTAPFRGGDSYAYYDGGRPYGDSYYGSRHVARGMSRGAPGATYRGPDGRWYPC